MKSSDVMRESLFLGMAISHVVLFAAYIIWIASMFAEHPIKAAITIPILFGITWFIVRFEKGRLAKHSPGERRRIFLLTFLFLALTAVLVYVTRF
jgi:hypothetical protein